MVGTLKKVIKKAAISEKKGKHMPLLSSGVFLIAQVQADNFN